MDMPYSGAALRSAATHFASRPSVPGINPQHFNPQPTYDLFAQHITTPPNQTGDAWETDLSAAPGSGEPNLAQVPVTHWWQGWRPTRSGVPSAVRDVDRQTAMVANHSRSNYVPDPARRYQHANQGVMLGYVPGREPRDAGISVPDDASWLVAGKNAFDATNGMTNVYSGDPANVGRYRLGVWRPMLGIYDQTFGRFGQTAELRAYTGRSPQMPVAKSGSTVPYNPNSAGTWHTPVAAPWQAPSAFALPDQESMTNYAIATQAAPASDFFDNSGMM